MTRKKHSHNPNKWVKNYTSEQISNIKTNFKLENILDKPINNLSISYYKYDYSISGRVGKFNFSLSNNGEYRYGFEYKYGVPFTLRNVDFNSISIYIETENGTHNIYNE